MEIDLDVWPLVKELLPLLEEIERVEAMAAGKTTEESSSEINDKESDQGAESGKEHNGRMEEG